MKNLITLLPVLFMVAYGITPEALEVIRANARKAHDECVKETGASEEDHAPLHAHSTPTTEKGKCLLACIFKKFGLLNDSGFGKENAEAFLERIKKVDEEHYRKVKPILENCFESTEEGKNECDTAAALHECLVREKQKAGFPVINLDS